ncbi:DUF5110 domain-containing protein [Bacillus coahuilensis]|uniref:glycoside hydrolase family 31 protein n=2 Tax=Bacillus coahuilensis TaxID=408580 RepID=UPI0030B80F05
MRYQLLPYLYNEFKEAADTGKPVQQPLVYQFQEDEKTHNISDQYMFGASMMLAPVVEEGQTQRDVYLPEGTTWTDYWTGEKFEGGQTMTVDAPLDHLPIFVKGDSIIPTRDVQQYTGEQPLETLILDTYVDDKVDYTFYEDDASTEEYKDGEYNETNFTVKRKKNAIVFNIDKKNEGFKDSKLNQVTLKVHNAEEPKKVKAASTKFKQVDSIEHVNDSTNTYFYDKESKTLYVGVSIDETKKVRMK